MDTTKERAVQRESREERIKRELDRKLDDQLSDTFPASDPPTITLPQADKEAPADRERRDAC